MGEKWAKFQTKAQKSSKVHFIWEIWWPVRECGKSVPYPGELVYMPIVHIKGNQKQKTALPIKGLQSTFSETETPMGQLVLGRCSAGSKLTVFNISTRDPN